MPERYLLSSVASKLGHIFEGFVENTLPSCMRGGEERCLLDSIGCAAIVIQFNPVVRFTSGTTATTMMSTCRLENIYMAILPQIFHQCRVQS